MSIEDLARHHIAKQLQVSNDSLMHGNFPQTASDHIYDEAICGCDYDTPQAAYQALRQALRDLHPDAYLIRSQKQQLICFEIEDTNTLTRNKLQRYVHAYFECDWYYWNLQLIVTDRYGMLWRNIPIITFADSQSVSESSEETHAES